MNAERHSELNSATRKKLFILEKLSEEFELMPKKLDPKLLKFHWSHYEKWMRESGIESNQQLMNILLSLEEEGLIKNPKWINPAV